MTRIIAVANQKGGVAKTTTSITLAHGLALRGLQVLLVDTDPQGSVASFLGIPKEEQDEEGGLFQWLYRKLPLAEAARSAAYKGYERPGLSLITSNDTTSDIQTFLEIKRAPYDFFQKALRDANVDFVVFDTAPSAALLQFGSIYAADWLLVPSATNFASSRGVNGIIAALKRMRDQGSDCALMGVLPTLYNEVTTESKATLAQLQQDLGGAVLAPIHEATILEQCVSEGRTIWEKDPKGKSRAAQEYEVLVERVLAHV